MNKNKVIYLAAYKALLNDSDFYDVLYQDKYIKRDIGGCMLEVDLSNYDFILASPPCNFWSRANYDSQMTNYTLSTKHLLPEILDKLIYIGKPFVVENVRNFPKFDKYGLFSKNCFYYFIGRHTFFSNIFISKSDVEFLNSFMIFDDINHNRSSSRQGGFNVNFVFQFFIDEYFKKNIDICI